MVILAPFEPVTIKPARNLEIVSRFLRSSPFQPSVERVNSSKCQFGGSVYVSNARLQLKKILPRSFFIRFGLGLIFHTNQHSEKTAIPSPQIFGFLRIFRQAKRKTQNANR
jgi:hypothetical protein